MGKDGAPVQCIVSVDEMSVKKGSRYDPGTASLVGDITFGPPGKNGNLQANKAMVIFLKDIEGKWEKIIGFFFTNGSVTGAILADKILEAFALLRDAGITALGLVCDGPCTNIAMLNKLGANYLIFLNDDSIE